MLIQPTSSRNAFTLVELLVVMLIAVILSSMVAIALQGTQQEARQTRAQAFIDSINLKLLQIYEEETSRQPNLPSGFTSSDTRSLSFLMWKRDWLRCALPDRREDLIEARVTVPYPTIFGMTQLDGMANSIRGQQLDRYRNRVVRLVGAASWAEAVDDDNQNNGEWTAEHQSAECLYLILSTRVVNGVPAVDMLRSRDVGDVDQDGMPEVLDPWGVPVGYVRWPSGFVLTGRWNDPPIDIFASTTRSDWTELASLKNKFGRDNVDILQVDPRYIDNQNGTLVNSNADDPFPLLPMVVSSGSDGEFDLYGLDNDPSWVPPASPFPQSRRPPFIDFKITGWPDRYSASMTVPGFSAAPAVFVDPYLDDQPISLKPAARLDINEVGGDGTDQSSDNVYPNLYF